MHELGNLAIVVANRSDAALIVHKGIATVCVGVGPDRARIVSAWQDDKRIHEIILALNHGEYQKKENLRGAA